MRRRNKKPGQGAGLQGASQGFSQSLASGPIGDPRARRNAQALGPTDLHFDSANLTLDKNRKISVRKAKAVSFRRTDKRPERKAIRRILKALKEAGLME